MTLEIMVMVAMATATRARTGLATRCCCRKYRLKKRSNVSFLFNMCVLFLVGVTQVAAQFNGGSVSELVIHLVPHTHIEHAWTDTMENYRRDTVDHIITQVVNQLSIDSTRRFVWAELAYFRSWYDSQAITTKTRVQELVANGQLEFVGGGFVEHDEALSTFENIISDVAHAHEWLHTNLGTRPRVAWQIDTAGHSQVTPAMYSKMGYDALVLNRVHRQVLQQFKTSQHLEFVWEGTNLGGKLRDEIFTHVMLEGYAAPEQCDFESPGVRQVVTPSRRSKYLVQLLQERARYYKTQNLLVPLGNRFRFYSAEKQFTNWDKLIRYINEKIPGVRIQYSTASEYFAAIRSTASFTGLKYPVFSESLFPYSESDDAYWVGGYSSRPELKASIRQLQSLVRNANTLFTIARARSDAIGDAPHVLKVEDGHVQAENALSLQSISTLYNELALARTISAISSNHHTLMGMVRADVADDIHNKVEQGARYALNTIRGSVETLLTMRKADFQGGGTRVKPTLDSSRSSIVLTDSGGDSQMTSVEHVHHPVVFYNTQLVPRVEVTKIRIDGEWRLARHIRVIDGNGDPVASQVQNELVSVSDKNNESSKEASLQQDDELSVDFPIKYKSVLYLHFAVQIPPLGVSTYFVHTTSARDRVQKGTVSSTAATPLTKVFHVKDGTVVVPDGMTAGEPKPKGASSFRRTQTDDSNANEDNGLATMSKFEPNGDVEGLKLENSKLLIEFHETTGLIKAVTDKVTKRRTLLNQDLRTYSSSKSGAVIFRPERVAESRSVGSSKVISITIGPLVQQISVIGNGFEQVVKLCSLTAQDGGGSSASTGRIRGSVTTSNSEARAGIMSNVGPRAIQDVEGVFQLIQRVNAESGTDVVMHYDTSMHSDGKLLVDNTVGQLIERMAQRDANLASTFYPAATTVGLRDQEPTAVSRMGQMLVLVSRTPHAVASPIGIGGGRSTGSIQVMLQRNHPNDDGCGLSEGLVEDGMATVNVMIAVDVPLSMQTRLSGIRYRQLNPLIPLFAKELPGTVQILGRKNWVSRFIAEASYLSPNLHPQNLELLSLEPQDAISDKVVARFRNTAPVVEETETEVQETIEPSSFLSPDFVVTSVRATSLATTQDVEQLKLSRTSLGNTEGGGSKFGVGGSISLNQPISQHRNGQNSARHRGQVSESLISTMDLATGGKWVFGTQQVSTFVLNLIALTDAQLTQHKQVFNAPKTSITEAPKVPPSVSHEPIPTTLSQREETKPRPAYDNQRSGSAESGYASLDQEIEELSKKISVENKKIARYTRNIDHFLGEIESLEEIDVQGEELAQARQQLSDTETQLARGREVLQVLEKELVVLKKRRSTPSSTLDGQFQNRPAEYIEREKEATMHGAIAGAGGMLVCVIALQWIFGRRKRQAYVPLTVGGTNNGNESKEAMMTKKL